MRAGTVTGGIAGGMFIGGMRCGTAINGKRL
jgi:hypothetical protein